MKYLYSMMGCVISIVLGVLVYRVDRHHPHLITIDIHEIVFKMAQSLAQQNLEETYLERRMVQFKKGLEISLKEFALKKKAIVLSKSVVYGEIQDETKAFIDYHNGVARYDNAS